MAKTNAIQKNYMVAKALVNTLKRRAQEIEVTYMQAHGIVDEEGKTPSHIWCIDDQEAFDAANAATCDECQALGIYDAEQLLRQAEDQLIEYGLSIAPKPLSGMMQNVRDRCFGENGKTMLLSVREKVIDLVLKLDVSTVR